MRRGSRSRALLGSASRCKQGRIAAAIVFCAGVIPAAIAPGQVFGPGAQIDPSATVRCLPPVEPVPLPESDPVITTPLEQEVDRVFASNPYVIVEMLGFQRDNQATNVPLVSDTLTGDTVLSVSDLGSPIACGVRAFVGVRRADSWGFEAGYLGVYGMGASRTVSGDENLQLDGPLASLVPLPYAAADSVQARYASSFQSVEINAFTSCSPGRDCAGAGCVANACPGDANCCIDWLGGIRYTNLAEQAGLLFTCCTQEPVGPFTSAYDVRTSNNLVGGQFGGRASKTWRSWAVDGWAKAGIFANIQSQSQAPILDPLDPETPARAARSATGVEPSMMADINVSVIYRLNSVCGLRIGYNAIWVGNVALAPNQWDFGTSPDSGTTLFGNGGLFLNGVNVGIDACW